MILVSSCLAGFPCRYDGASKTNEKVKEFVLEGKAIPVCPEQLGGLTTPRLPSEIRDGKVFNSEGYDVTQQFEKGAAAVLQIATQYGCTKAILKARSPSCGKGQVYDGTFSGKLVDGNGKTVELLLRNGIEVITE